MFPVLFCGESGSLVLEKGFSNVHAGSSLALALHCYAHNLRASIYAPLDLLYCALHIPRVCSAAQCHLIRCPSMGAVHMHLLALNQ